MAIPLYLSLYAAAVLLSVDEQLNGRVSTDLTAPAAAEGLAILGASKFMGRRNFFIILAMCWWKNTAQYVLPTFFPTSMLTSLQPPLNMVFPLCGLSVWFWVPTLNSPPLTHLAERRLIDILATCLLCFLTVLFLHTDMAASRFWGLLNFLGKKNEFFFIVFLAMCWWKTQQNRLCR